MANGESDILRALTEVSENAKTSFVFFNEFYGELDKILEKNNVELSDLLNSQIFNNLTEEDVTNINKGMPISYDSFKLLNKVITFPEILSLISNNGQDTKYVSKKQIKSHEKSAYAQHKKEENKNRAAYGSSQIFKQILAKTYTLEDETFITSGAVISFKSDRALRNYVSNSKIPIDKLLESETVDIKICPEDFMIDKNNIYKLLKTTLELLSSSDQKIVADETSVNDLIKEGYTQGRISPSLYNRFLYGVAENPGFNMKDVGSIIAYAKARVTEKKNN